MDHEELASAYPNLQPFLVSGRQNGASSIDFLSAEATRFYNQALLHRWFGIKLSLPSNHLCPTALSRTRYIRWIASLVQYCPSQQEQIVGIDVGTGASCVYPLLGKAIYNWNFIATDIDDESLASAAENVKQNCWTDSISVIRAARQDLSDGGQSTQSPLFHILQGALDAPSTRKLQESSPTFSSAHFSMCNPPFFESVEDKVPRQDTVCIATASELATSGGEVEFVKQMMYESAQLGERVSWYTTLLGKKSSLYPLVAYLKTLNPLDIQDTTFKQGRNTRWALAWTFSTSVKARLVAERASALRYSAKTFIFDSYYESVAEVEQALKELPLDVKFKRDAEAASPTFSAAVYETSSWLNTTFSSTQASTNAIPTSEVSMIGPFVRPKVLFSMRVKIVALQYHNHLSLVCDHLPGAHPVIILGGIEYTTEHIFGVLAREIKKHTEGESAACQI